MVDMNIVVPIGAKRAGEAHAVDLQRCRPHREYFGLRILRIAIEIEEDGDAIGSDALRDAAHVVGTDVGEMLEGPRDAFADRAGVGRNDAVGEGLETPAIDALPDFGQQACDGMIAKIGGYEAHAQSSVRRRARAWAWPWKRRAGMKSAHPLTRGAQVRVRRQGHGVQGKRSYVPRASLARRVEQPLQGRKKSVDAVPLAAVLSGVGQHCQRVGIRRIELDRARKRRFGIAVAGLLDTQGADVGQYLRVVGRANGGIAKARFRFFEAAAFLQSNRSPQQGGIRQISADREQSTVAFGRSAEIVAGELCVGEVAERIRMIGLDGDDSPIAVERAIRVSAGVERQAQVIEDRGGIGRRGQRALIFSDCRRKVLAFAIVVAEKEMRLRTRRIGVERTAPGIGCLGGVGRAQGEA